jgi:carbonic anhydrase/acetyltransferase-like protein (isoleucine patch superfamily)
MILNVDGHVPDIADEVFLAPNATVAGRVTLARGVSVWFGSVLRSEKATISVGADTNLQDLTIVHTDAEAPVVVGERVTVGHRVVLHGCTVGDDALIGMGAVVMNGARIGVGAVVGAGAVVTEGTVVPDGGLAVGVPAKVLDRPVPPVPRPNVANYLDLAERYRSVEVVQHAGGFAVGPPPEEEVEGE